MKNAILQTLQKSQQIIISPDIDGFISADLLSRKFGSTVVGTYDSYILCLADGINVEDCLFVDCDMNRQNLVSIGNHMRLQNDNMSDRSFNPNRFYEVEIYSRKFPYATCYLISSAIEIDLSISDLQRMAYADSTLLNMIKYSDNMQSWSKKLRHSDIEGIVNQTIDISAMSGKYQKQSFTSKNYGKARYLETINNALKSEGIKHIPVTTGIRYMNDRVGKNTVVEYNKDIISYAQIYTDEFSVTYDREVEWK